MGTSGNARIRRSLRVVSAAGVVLLGTEAAVAQSALAGVVIQADVQHFPEDEVSSGLNGTSLGWTILGGAGVGSHLTVRGELSRHGDIDHVDSFSVDIDGRVATVRYGLVHNTRSASVMGGFTHAMARARFFYLGGVSFTHVDRTFTTNAPGLILFPAGSRPDTAIARRVDDFPALIVGGDAIVSVAPHLALVAGVRWQPLELEIELSGHSIRPLVGAAWMF